MIRQPQRRINHNYAKDLRVGDVVSVNDLVVDQYGKAKHYQIRLGHITHVYVNSVVVQYKHIFDRDTGTEIYDYDNHRHVVSGKYVTVIQSAGGDYYNELDFQMKTSPVASKRQEVETMLKQGVTHFDIAKKLHMSPKTITRIAKETNMEVSR